MTVSPRLPISLTPSSNSGGGSRERVRVAATPHHSPLRACECISARTLRLVRGSCVLGDGVASPRELCAPRDSLCVFAPGSINSLSLSRLFSFFYLSSLLLFPCSGLLLLFFTPLCFFFVCLLLRRSCSLHFEVCIRARKMTLSGFCFSRRIVRR